MNRRRTASYRRRGKGKKGFGPQIALVGVIGLAGAVWFAKKHARGDADAQPIALSARPQQVEIAQAAQPAGNPGSNVTTIDQGQPPAQLVEAFAQLAGGDPQALVDLRRLAVEFAGSAEAARATTALENERQRCLKRADALKGDPVEQLRHLTRAYLATLDPDARRGLRKLLDAASQEVFFSGRQTYGTTSYTVVSGDSLSRIAKQHGGDYRQIKRFNGMQNDRIRVGQRLRVPTEPVQVVVFKRDFELVLLYADMYLRAFDCATGKNGCTPEGEFTIGAGKLVNPDWYAPDGKVYPYGTEGNVLGTRWLPFENTPEHQGFGIHGTKFPESIGTEASMGCLRLRNPNAEVVYDLVPSGSRVRIVR